MVWTQRAAVLGIVLAVGACRSPSPAPSSPPPLRVQEVGDGETAMVLMHGYGARGDDLVPLATSLAAQLAIRFVLPEAPRERKRGGGRSWFDPFAGQDTAPQLEASRAYVTRVIEALHNRGYTNDRILIGGFSQGAIMSVDVGRHTKGLAGLVLLSGTPLPLWTDYESLAGTPVFMAHGTKDRILDFAKAEALRASLERAGAKVTWFAFDGGHSIPPEVVAGLRAFLAQRVSTSR